MEEVRIILGLEEFEDLIRGKIVDKKFQECHVKIAFSDIGILTMTRAVVEAGHEWAMNQVVHEPK